MQAFQSHACTVIFYRVYADTGGVEFLSFTYTETKNNHPVITWRFPTESQDEYNNRETPLETLTACVTQEIALDEKLFPFQLTPQEPVYSDFVQSQKDRTGKHAKLVFLAQTEHTAFRTTPKDDRKLVGDKIEVETLGPPEWHEAEELHLMMEQRGTSFHRSALLKALETLAVEKKVFEKYINLLKKPAR
ncbi:MAG: hypothetical protein WCT19_02720 [Candidatus Paceibacterota bacterium]|jgi:hypothetical protein